MTPPYRLMAVIRTLPVAGLVVTSQLGLESVSGSKLLLAINWRSFCAGPLLLVTCAIESPRWWRTRHLPSSYPGLFLRSQQTVKDSLPSEQRPIGYRSLKKNLHIKGRLKRASCGQGTVSKAC